MPLHNKCNPKKIPNNYEETYWTANSLVGVRIRTLIACTRFGRNNNLSKVGSANAAVCMVAGYEHRALKETSLYKSSGTKPQKHCITNLQSPK